MMRNYWVSWHDEDPGMWELHSPWWVSGEDSRGRPIICAAVRAESELDAKNAVAESHDDWRDAAEIVWRFCEPKPDGWSPFGSRFPRADWMVWDVCCTLALRYSAAPGSSCRTIPLCRSSAGDT